LTQKYAATIQSDEERALWSDFNAKWQVYVDLGDTALRLAEQQKQAEAEKLIGEEGKKAYDPAGKANEKLGHHNPKGAQAATHQSEQTFSRSRAVAFALLGIAIVMGALIAIVVSRSVSQPMASVIETFKHISAGKLDNAIDTSRQDEIGALLASLADMQSH